MTDRSVEANHQFDAELADCHGLPPKDTRSTQLGSLGKRLKAEQAESGKNNVSEMVHDQHGCLQIGRGSRKVIAAYIPKGNGFD
jgi:hypothetical protein